MRGADAAPAPVPVPTATESAELIVDGVRVRESPFVVDWREGRLRGVLTEPADGPRAGHTAVLLSGGAVRRIGQGRMWVEIARDWAAAGVPTLRVDLARIGEADGVAEPYGGWPAFYTSEFVDQVGTVLDALEAQGAPSRFITAGLCSGAYWSFQTAIDDERVAAAFLLNPGALVWGKRLRYERTAKLLLKELVNRRNLGKLLEPRRFLHRIGQLGVVVRGTLHASRRSLERLAQPDADPVERALDRLRDRGKRALIVFGEGETVRSELEARGHLDRADRWPNVQFAFVEGSDHTMRRPQMKRQARIALDRALEAELARARSDSATSRASTLRPDATPPAAPLP
jgi:hypothetical protein